MQKASDEQPSSAESLSVEEFVAQAKAAPVPNDQQETPVSVMPRDELAVDSAADGSDATVMLDLSETSTPSETAEEAVAQDTGEPPKGSEDATVMMELGELRDKLVSAQPRGGVEETGEHTRMLPAANEVKAPPPPVESTDVLPAGAEVLEPSGVLQAIISQDDGDEVVSFPLDYLGEKEESTVAQPAGDDATRLSLPAMTPDAPVAGTAQESVAPMPGQTSGALRAVLTVLSGADSHQRFLIGRGVTYVGRSHDCQVVLQDLATSRRHFRIESTGEEIRLIDMGSENGTLVNGQRVDEHVLTRGDRITLGATILHFGHPDDDTPALESAHHASDEGGIWGLIGIIAGIALALAALTVGGGQLAGWWDVLGGEDSERDKGRTSEETIDEAEVADPSQLVAVNPVEETDETPTTTESAGEEVDAATEPTPAPVEPTEPPAEDTPEPAVAAERLEACRKHLKARSLTEAAAALAAAQDAGADAAVAHALGEQLRLANGDKSLVNRLQKAVEERRWTDGLGEASEVSADSVFSEQVAALVAQLRTGLLNAKIEKAAEHLQSKEWSQATTLVDEVLAQSADHEKARALRDAIEAGQKEEAAKVAAATAKEEESASASADDGKIAAADASDAVKPAGADDASSEDKEDSPAPAAVEPGKTFSPTAAHRAYSNGDFSGARRRCTRASKDVTLPATEQGRASKLAAAIRQFEKHYNAGMAAAQGGQAGAAVGPLKKALRLDRRINRSYQRGIKDTLGRTYGTIATRAESGRRNYEAVKAARDALKYSPGSSVATRVMATVDQRVDRMISQGQTAADAGRRGRAKRKLKEVLLILKVLKKKDGRVDRTKAILNQL